MLRKKTAILFYPSHGKHLMLPIAVLPIRKRLANSGYDVVIIDAQISSDWRTLLYENAKKASLLGVSCISGKPVRCSQEAVAIAKSVQPSIVTVWGGYHATIYHEELIASGYADYVVRGQGECEIDKLASLLSETSPVDGHARHEVSRVLRQEPWWECEKDTLLNLDYSCLPVEEYRTMGMKWIPYISSYGCKGNCGFCVEPNHSNRKWYVHSKDKVIDDLGDIFCKLKWSRVSLLDPNFAIDVKRAAEIAVALSKSGMQLRLACNMRANDIVLLSNCIPFVILRRAGFRKIFIGVESGSTSVLKTINKGISPDIVIEACLQLHEAKIFSIVSFMHDFPFETEQDSRQTLELSRTLAKFKTNRQMHHFFFPFEGTALGEIYCKNASDIGYDVSTYGDCLFWEGRKSFRCRVVSELLRIKKDYPTAFADHKLPVP